MKKQIILALASAAALVACWFINMGGAFMGDPAPFVSLLATAVLIVVYSAFICSTGKTKKLATFAFWLSLVHSASAVLAVLVHSFQFGWFISYIIGFTVAVPFYGFRFFANWEITYILAAAVTSVWFIISTLNLKKLKK